MEELSFRDFEVGKKFDFGSIVLSEDDIISWAKLNDPLDIHTDRDAAQRSIFKGLIASGAHIFTIVHKSNWIPRFKESVIAGLGVNNWKFIKPVYPDQMIYSSVTIAGIQPNPEKRQAVITWLYEFKDEKGEMVQSLELTDLHKMD